MKASSIQSMFHATAAASSSTDEESVELKSTTGSATYDEQSSAVIDNWKQSRRQYLYRDRRRNLLQQSSASGHILNSSSNFEENIQKQRKYRQCRSNSKYHCNKHHPADSETSQDTTKGYRCGCCHFCLLIMKCTSILCYVFCCPPVPELIIRKLAFHPLAKGRTYLVSGNDPRGNHIQTKSAKKAFKFKSLNFEPQQLVEGRPLSLKNVDISIIKTRRGSYLPFLRINCLPTRNQNAGIQDFEPSELVVLFSQPNSSDLGCYFQPHGISLLNISNLLAVTVYAYDYSGYGISTGSASEKNIYADIEAVYRRISETRGSNVRIALLGYSIGTAPTVYMASKHPPNLCGIILIAPFASGLRLYTKRDRTCCMDRFLSYERAPEVNVPVLICHGGMDDVIPISHSETLLERFPRAVAPYFVEQANHLTIFSGRYLSVFLRIHHFLLHETDPLQSSTNIQMNLVNSLIVVFELVTITMEQAWLPYETYDQEFYNQRPYQGIRYNGGCTNIIITGVPCQQPLRQWNLYPDNYQLQYYNMRPYIPEMMSQIFVPFGNGDSILPQNPGNIIDLLRHGTYSSGARIATSDGSSLSAKLLGANILNDRDKFEARGCSYDTNLKRCSDNLNICKGKCKDFGGGLAHDCRCIPEDLLAILGLTILRE